MKQKEKKCDEVEGKRMLKGSKRDKKQEKGRKSREKKLYKVNRRLNESKGRNKQMHTKEMLAK